jgi:hypothetical protein
MVDERGLMAATKAGEVVKGRAVLGSLVEIIFLDQGPRTQDQGHDPTSEHRPKFFAPLDDTTK